MEKRGDHLFQDDSFDSYQFRIILNSIFVVLVIFVLIPALLLQTKIYKFIRFSDIPMLCSISALSLSLIFLIGSFFASILDNVSNW